MKRMVLFGLALSLLAGCTLAKVKVDVASERTTLENQVLGSYNALSDEVLLVASVRGVDPLGRIESPPRRSGEGQAAAEAVQVLAFHADDVDAFKRLGWAGEDNRGRLAAFPLDRSKVPPELKDFVERFRQAEFEAVLKAVNAAREAVMRRVVETTPGFSAADLDRVRAVFGKLNAENAQPGERIQTADGAWTVKR